MSDEYLFRPMTIDDIGQVITIERLSFSMPWSPLTYFYEIQQNRAASMAVIELPDAPPIAPTIESSRFQIFPFRRRNQKPVGCLTAFGGMWVKQGEAHISTIATHPDYRGQSLGELMLYGLIQRGIECEANHVVLEVRANNTIAQNLYHKYGFEKTGIRPMYYHDNNEDAYVMTVPSIDAAYRRQLDTYFVALQQKVLFQDHFTGQNQVKEE